MALGRMAAGEKYKGFDEIMELLRVLSKQIPHFAYLIVGDGDDRLRLDAKAQTLGARDGVVFTGFIPSGLNYKSYQNRFSASF